MDAVRGRAPCEGGAPGHRAQKGRLTEAGESPDSAWSSDVVQPRDREGLDLATADTDLRRQARPGVLLKRGEAHHRALGAGHAAPADGLGAGDPADLDRGG